MFMKHCLPALACALPFSRATGSYAQRVGLRSSLHPLASAARRTPASALLSMKDALRIKEAPAPAIAHMSSAFHRIGTPRPNAISNSAFYACVPAPGNVWFDPVLGTGTPGASGLGTNDVLDDIALPIGVTKTSGASLTKIIIDVLNGDTNSMSAPHDIHGVITIYDTIDETQTANVAVTPLLTIPFDATGADALPYGYDDTITLTLTTPLTLTHDFGSATKPYYGVQLATFDDATRAKYSQYIYPALAYGNTSAEAKIGFSNDLLFFDIFDNGLFPNNQGGSLGGAPYVSNLSLELDGNSPDDLTYNVSGTFVFPGLQTGAPDQPVTATFQSTSHPAAAPIVISATLPLSDYTDASGAVTGQQTFAVFFGTAAGGLPADTYKLTVTSPNFKSSMQTITLPATDVDVIDNTPPAPPTTYMSTGNLRALNITFTPTTTTATGTIALEGVPDLSQASFNAPLGPYTIEFYTPGAVSFNSGAVPVYSKTVATLTPTSNPAVGSYKVSGIPFGTYDVVIKAPKNLAVKDASVAFSAPTGAVIPAVTLPAGDANNDDSVDSSDFGILIGAFGVDSNVTGSGYDPAADFNYDGIIDSSDFGLLIGEFNNQGAK